MKLITERVPEELTPKHGMKLTPEQSELLPSEEEIAHYNEHGWYISKEILSDAEIEDAFAGSERHYSGERDYSLPIQIRSFLDWTPEKGEGLRLNDYIVIQNLQIQKLAFNALIGAIASRLSGSDRIRLWNSQLIYKPSQVQDDRVKIGWHVDRAYWRTCTSDRMLTAWIPLHDCDETTGTMIMLDGSHRWPSNASVDELRRGKTFLIHAIPESSICSDASELEARISSCGMPINKVPMNLHAGQVCFHNCLTFHGSGLNRSTTDRRVVVIHLQDGENRYRVSKDESGEVHRYNNDLMCRKLSDGSPDYSDPIICPLLWENK